MTYLRVNTPLENHMETYGLLVKREDLSCPPPGPPFSKTRGVLPHVEKAVKRGAKIIGVLDTSHSQGGWAVAQACKTLGVKCFNYYPVYKAEIIGSHGEHNLRDPQTKSLGLGATMFPLDAGRSAVLYHRAKHGTEMAGGYMMPNALKLPETVEETAAEVVRTFENADRKTYQLLSELPWIVSASSGTIAAGVFRGLRMMREVPPKVIVHMGYSRSQDALIEYMVKMSNIPLSEFAFEIIDEGYAYKDKARYDYQPDWPCNPYYDLKAFQWHQVTLKPKGQAAVLWNVG